MRSLSAGNLDLSRSCFSLTGGLDTRAIFVDLVAMNKKISAYTVTGETLSLDARIARKLCRDYGIEHTIIELTDEFYRSLPDYACEASRLTGGITSLGQAHEVHLYKTVPATASARLTGNLGNQVCRRGTEKISTRNAQFSLFLSEGLTTTRNQADHWYADQHTGECLEYEFLLQQEVPFSSVANYSLGNHFMVQQSPYADRRLIEIGQIKPMAGSVIKRPYLLQMRVRDLRHRFAGESELSSFQVKLIKDRGGPAASCPINWGWCASGNLSLAGKMLGTGAFIDALVCSTGQDGGMLHQGLKILHIAGLHEFTRFRAWIKYLKEFILTLLESTTVRQSGLFHEERTRVMVEEHYASKRDHTKHVMLALDLALAASLFKAQLKPED